MFKLSVRSFAVFFSLILFIAFSPISVFASSDNKRASDLDKVFEKIGLFMRSLIDKRLFEMGSVAENSELGVFEETSSRYATYVGRYTEYIVTKKLSGQKESTNQMFNKHKEILTPFLYKYDYNSAWWLLLQQDIDTINIFQKKINNEI